MPSDVKIKKADGQTGVTLASADGILAIIAPSEKGTVLPSSATKSSTIFDTYGNGALSEYAAYVLDVTQNQVVLAKTVASTAGSYGTFARAGTGTSIMTGDVATVTPLDDYDLLVTIVNGGTIGTTGATLTVSLDGGRSTSAIIALGTATNYTVPDSGVKVAFAAGTLVAGDTYKSKVAGPVMTNAEVVIALEALRVSPYPFEAVLIAGTTDAAGVTALQSWIDARENDGRMYHAYVNARMRNVGETPAAYLTAMVTAYGAVAAPSVTINYDGGRVGSLLANRRQYVRAASLGHAARAMNVDVSVMPSRVQDGPIKGFSIVDERGLAEFHDESIYPGPGANRFTVFRSRQGRTGVYIDLPFLFSAVGSDYVFLPHVRVMNRAIDLARGPLTDVLSQGERKGANGFILESEAQKIEAKAELPLANQLVRPLKVSDAGFVLSRNDDVSSNAGAKLTGDVWIVPLIYVSGIEVKAKFLSKSLSV